MAGNPQPARKGMIVISQTQMEVVASDGGRDPEDRRVAPGDESAIREKMFDKTLADSYPASDPPSSIPNPSTDSMLSIERAEGRKLKEVA